jgi:hypothetical protein
MLTCEDPCQVIQVMATKHTLWIHANMTQILNIATKNTLWIYVLKTQI